MDDINTCRNQLLQVTKETLQSFAPIIEASRDVDNEVFVKLARHEMTWGGAVLCLQRSRTKLRANFIARADHVGADIDKLQQAQLNRRTALMSSVVGILP